MDENQREVFSLIEDYFENCRLYGHSDFEEWCEDNLENSEQIWLFNTVKDSVNLIADALFN